MQKQDILEGTADQTRSVARGGHDYPDRSFAISVVLLTQSQTGVIIGFRTSADDWSPHPSLSSQNQQVQAQAFPNPSC
jgi:hypothetical protein